MMIALLWLGAIVCVASREIQLQKVYGSSHQFRMHSKTRSIEFNPKDTSAVRILWAASGNITDDTKHEKIGHFFILRDLTQMDSGRYVMKDKDQGVLSTYTLDVKAIIQDVSRHYGEDVRLTFDLEPNSCNIYFSFSQGGMRAELVRQGKLQEDLDRFGCKGFELLEPCGISNDALQTTCKGLFEIRDRNKNSAFMVYLRIEAIYRSYERLPGSNLNFTLDVEPHSCNIYFNPYDRPLDFLLVHQGELQKDLSRSGCKGFKLLKPCGIKNDALQMSCQGDFSIRDQKENRALEVSLAMQRPPVATSYVNTGVGVFLAILFCGFMARYYCGGTPPKKRAATSAAKVDVQYQQYDHEPVGARTRQLRQPSGTHTPTVPLIHSHPGVNGPPASSEVEGFPTILVHSDEEPRFELKGMTSFTSDSNHCEVYTSDKLNFL